MARKNHFSTFHIQSSESSKAQSIFFFRVFVQSECIKRHERNRFSECSMSDNRSANYKVVIAFFQRTRAVGILRNFYFEIWPMNDAKNSPRNRKNFISKLDNEFFRISIVMKQFGKFLWKISNYETLIILSIVLGTKNHRT